MHGMYEMYEMQDMEMKKAKISKFFDGLVDRARFFESISLLDEHLDSKDLIEV